jgi:hypothetical protein
MSSFFNNASIVADKARMIAKFHTLTDEELLTLAPPHDLLAARYRELRDHHIAEIEALTKRDRSAILRMAGNIAGGLVSASYCTATEEELAKKAVALARAIVTEVDR